MSDEEDRLFDESVEKVHFMWSVGLNPIGSVAERLVGVRYLLHKLRKLEAEIEDDVRSGNFNKAVSGKPHSVFVTDTGSVLVLMQRR